MGIVAGISALECLTITIGSVCKIPLIKSRLPVSILQVFIIVCVLASYIWSWTILRQYNINTGAEIRENVQIITKIASLYFMAIIVVYIPFGVIMTVNRIKSKNVFLSRKLAFWFILCRMILYLNGIINSLLFFSVNRQSRRLLPLKKAEIHHIHC